MAEKLPGVNFQAPLATDDLEFQQQSNGEEIQERTRLVMGEVGNTLGRFGIVDATDPQDIATTDQDRPLVVTVSNSNPLQVDIAPGTAVTACGNWVELQSRITNLDLAASAAGAVNVIFIEYYTEDGTDRRVNKFNVDVAVRNQRPADNDDVIGVDILSNFTDPAQYSPDRRKDIVVLAVVTVNQLADLTLDLAIDLSGNNFDTDNGAIFTNRPWYSPVDVEHRTQVGTAEPTTTNPHGTSLNDIAAGRLTLYQQTVAHGMVLSKDVDRPRYPGIKTTETLIASSFDTDTSGLVTRRSAFFGGAGSQYVSLQNFPIAIGSAYATGNPARQVSVDFVPDTSTLVVPANEPIPEEGITVEYFYSSAGQGPINPSTNDLVFLQPEASELIIADGIAVSEIPTPVISFDGSGPIPRDFRVLLDSNGDLISSPQILQPPIKLDAMGDTDLAITRSMRGVAPIEIGLTRANDVGGMEIAIELTGLDQNGSAYSETLTFQFGVWSDTAIPATQENLQQFLRSDGLFSQLDTARVDSRTNDGNDSTIIIYADQEAAVTDTFKEKCPLADVFWDGLAVDAVLDARPVNLELELPRTPTFVGASNAQGRAWAYEDFRKPRFSDSFEGDEAPAEATGSITIVDNNNWTDGDTIDLGNSKVLTAKTPAAAAGQISALDVGLNVPLGSTNFIWNETGGGVGLNISIPNGANSMETIRSAMQSGMNAASSRAATNYTVTVTGNRSFLIQVTGGNIDIAVSPFATLVSFPTGVSDITQQSAGQPGINDGDTFTLNDGTNEETFEFDLGGGLNNGDNVAVNVNPAALAAEVVLDMEAAINDPGVTLDITAQDSGTTVLLENDNLGDDGNQPIVESLSSGYSLNPIGMAGGTLGGANPAVGEFNVGIGTNYTDTVNNIIATLADPTFDSGVAGTADDTVVDLERTAGGVANNVITGSFTITTPEPANLSGFIGGAGRYLTTSADAFAEGLRTRIPTQGTDLDSVRKKYRSRSIGVPVGLQDEDVSIINLVMHNPENVSGGTVSTPPDVTFVSSVRVNAAFESDPGNWKGFEEMELVERNPSYVVFEKDFGAAIDKVQFEMYGIFTDFALSDVTQVAAIGQGPTGATGAAGTDGAAGATGATGVSVAGPTGATGPATASWYSDTFTGITTQTFVHGLGTENVHVVVYDSNNEVIIPQLVDVVDANNVNIEFAVATTGRVVIVGEV